MVSCSFLIWPGLLHLLLWPGLLHLLLLLPSTPQARPSAVVFPSGKKKQTMWKIVLYIRKIP
jgi:hypothetical protein